jgi:hypothetical protein
MSTHLVKYGESTDLTPFAQNTQLTKYEQARKVTARRLCLCFCVCSAVAGILYMPTYPSSTDTEAFPTNNVVIETHQFADKDGVSDFLAAMEDSSPAKPILTQMPLPPSKPASVTKPDILPKTAAPRVNTGKSQSTVIAALGTERFDSCTGRCETRDTLVVGSIKQAGLDSGVLGSGRPKIVSVIDSNNLGLDSLISSRGSRLPEQKPVFPYPARAPISAPAISETESYGSATLRGGRQIIGHIVNVSDATLKIGKQTFYSVIDSVW